jgi:peroxiredoxin
MLLGVFAYGFLTRTPDESTSAPRIGAPLADFTLPDLHGQPVQLSALRGKVVFVNVWATWCPPCIEEMPTIQQLYQRLHAKGLEVLAVSLDALGAQVVEPFMQNRRLSFPALLDTKNLVQRLYRTTGVPESFIVDKRGLLVEKIVGPRDWVHTQMLANFERLLAMQ